MRSLALSLVLVAGCAPPATPARPGDVPRDTTEADAPDAPFASEDDYRRQRAATRARLDEAVGQARASDVAQCRVAPITEQACGGPTAWAVYSAADGDAAVIEGLAARLVALDVRANAQFGRVSTCVAYSPPEPVVRRGRCADPNGAP